LNSVKISKNETLRKHIKKLTRKDIEKVSKDIPQILDTTEEMNNKHYVVNKSEYIGITSKIAEISKTIGFCGIIYINKDKFKKAKSDLKIKKYAMEIEYSVIVEKEVFRRRISLTKLKHSLFLCPNPDDLISLL
jgi:hypothetical protein